MYIYVQHKLMQSSACEFFANVLIHKMYQYALIIKFSLITVTHTNYSFYLGYRTIAYSVSKTRFFVGKPPFVPVTRELPITNTFSFTMIIYDAAFPSEVENVFSVSTDFFGNCHSLCLWILTC